MATIPYTIKWWLILALAIAPYTPLVIGAIKQKDKSHSAFTWGLYTMLDTLTFFFGTEERINMDGMVLGYAIGSLFMTLILIYQKRFTTFGKIEIITIILIVICIIVKFTFSKWALTTSIASETIIGIYLITQTFKYPKIKYNLIGYLGFIVVGIISMIVTKDWSIAEVGFALSETLLSFVILIPLIKKWRKLNKRLRLIRLVASKITIASNL